MSDGYSIAVFISLMMNIEGALFQLALHHVHSIRRSKPEQVCQHPEPLKYAQRDVAQAMGGDREARPSVNLEFRRSDCNARSC